MKLESTVRSIVPGLCVAVAGAVFLWWYGQGVAEHLTVTTGDTLWRGIVSFLGNLLWVGLGMAAVQLAPRPRDSKTALGVVLVVVAAALLAACGAFRVWAELDQSLGGVYMALTMGRPVALLFLLDGALLGYGMGLVRARA